MKGKNYLKPTMFIMPLPCENFCLVNSGTTTGVVPGMSWEGNSGTTHGTVPGMSWEYENGGASATVPGMSWEEYEKP